MEKIVIVGAGAHAHVVLQLLHENGYYDIVGCVDRGEGFCKNIPIIGDDDKLPELYSEGIKYAFVAVGNNKVREKLITKCLDIGYTVPTLVSKYAILAEDVVVKAGSMIMPGAVVNSGAEIGIGCIINTNAIIEHDDMICNYVHVAPGAAIAGSTVIGDCSFLGIGCRVIDRIVIGHHVNVGAGAVVIDNVDDNCTVVGVPAKVIK